MNKKLRFLLAFAYSAFITTSIIAQQLPEIQLKTGTKTYDSNLKAFLNQAPSQSEIVNGYYYQIIQFEKIPNENEKAIFQENNIEFLEYIPNQAYLIKVPSDLDKSFITQTNAKMLTSLDQDYKIEYRLIDHDIPEHAVDGNKIRVALIAIHGLQIREFKDQLSSFGIKISNFGLDQRFAYCSIAKEKISELAALPWLRYIEIIDEEGIPESTQGRTLQKSNTINNQLANGLNYNAEGVNILVRDDGLVGPHIDFEGRLFNLTSDATGTHGDGVAGVMGGAGNIDPSVEGGASGADVYVINYLSTFQDNTLSLHQNDNVVVTNTSYSNGCNAGYTSSTQTVDNQIFNNPTLMHVFSAGNSNNNDCGYGAGNQWGNVTGGHKVGKNAMTTANLFYDGTIVSSSSRGPAHDGRIKPDISAHGQGQMSTNPNNAYAPFGGTSAAAPSMAGNLAQLYDAYRSLNGGNDPKSSLIKAAVLNSATDIGVEGPDFIHGYGLINAGRAYEILEGNQYLFNTVSQGGSNTHSINIPGGLGQLKVMIYWHDPAATVNANKALVNDLDLKVNGNLLPLVLNEAPNANTLDDPAVPGIDRLNNVEQVVIENPSAGNYTINVSGFQVPQGPQEYVMVYSFIQDAITVTYPLGGESLIPGQVETIHWDAHGNAGNFTVEYSTNNGSSWNSVGSTNGADRLIDWTVPNSSTGQALIRVSRSGQSDTSEETFNIFPVPDVNVIAISSTEASITWDAIPGATSYDIYNLGTKYMEVIGSSTSNNFLLDNLTSGDQLWIAVAANGNGVAGQRSIASSYTFLPGSSCGGCISGSTSFPDIIGFESGLEGFCNYTGDDLDFVAFSGSTPSSSTGPSSAFEGNQYIYLEASSPNYPSKNAILGSPCYDLSNASSATLSFRYHMYGGSMGRLDLQVSTDGGSTWSDNIWSRNGDQGNNWLLANINLDAYTGDLFTYRFIAETGSSWQSDIALDDITFDAIINEPSSVIGEVGNVNTNHVYTTVNLQNTYINPIVVAGPPTINGSNPSTIRINNVTPNSFDIRIDEYEYLDQSHTTETIGYMVVEAGEHTLEDGRMIKAGSTISNSNFATTSLETTFPATPAIFIGVVTINDPTAVMTRLRNINSTSFEIRIQEQESVRTHGNETVHWIAMEENLGFAGIDYQCEITGRSFSHNVGLLPIAEPYNSNKIVIGNMSSNYGGDVSALRIYPNYNGAGNLGTKVEEEQSRDSEVAHTTEEINFAIFEQSGNLTGTLNTDNEQDVVVVEQKNSTSKISTSSVIDGFRIYPNPNDGNFDFEIPSLKNYDINSNLRILNLEGKEVYSDTVKHSKGSIRLNLENGIYFMQLTTSEVQYSSKFIIQK